MSPDTIVLIVAISFLLIVFLFAVWLVGLQGLIRSGWVLPARILVTIFSLLVVTYLLWNLQNIQAHYWVLISLYVGLVGVTVVYALSTARQAEASVKMVEEITGFEILAPPQPQLTGAIGAALFAMDS